MPERVMRSMAPEKYQPSANAGIARYDQSRNQNVIHVVGSAATNALRPLPRTGSQPSWIPNTMIRTSPTKKPGIDSPNSAASLPARSHHELTFSAESMPNGTPSTIEITNAANPSFRELGSRSK